MSNIYHFIVADNMEELEPKLIEAEGKDKIDALTNYYVYEKEYISESELKYLDYIYDFRDYLDSRIVPVDLSKYKINKKG